MDRIKLIWELAKVFVANPSAALKKLRPDNVRRLFFASSLYGHAAVVEAAKNHLQRS